MVRSECLSEDMAYFIHWHIVFCPADDDIDSKRAAYEAWCHSYTPPLDENLLISEMVTASNVALKIYQPARHDSSHALPWVLYLHGGMFTYGSLDSQEHVVASLCKDLQAAIICVDYRLVPEAAYPAAEHDCAEALEYIFNQSDALGLDRERGMVMGDDAGASLALALGRQFQHKAKIALITALYPLFPTKESDKHHPILSTKKVNQFWHEYMQNKEDDWNFYLDQDLSNHPATILFVPELDACAEEAYQYAHKLKNAGNEMILLDGNGMVHDCIHALRVNNEVKEMYERMVDLIKERLSITSKHYSTTASSN